MAVSLLEATSAELRTETLPVQKNVPVLRMHACMHAWALHFALLPFVYFGRRRKEYARAKARADDAAATGMATARARVPVPWIMSVFSASVQALLLPTIDAWSEASGQWRKARAS